MKLKRKVNIYKKSNPNSKQTIDRKLVTKIIKSSIIIEDEPYMVAIPFAKALGFSNGRNAIATLVSLKNQIDMPNLEVQAYMRTKTKFVNLQGIYELIVRSKMPKAKTFWLWIVKKLLPQIQDDSFCYKDWCLLNQALVYKFEETQHGNIYVLTNDFLVTRQVYQIGMTKNLVARLHELNYLSDKYFYNFTFNTVHAENLKTHLHLKFANQYVSKKFLKLSDNDISEIPKICNEFVSNKK